MRPLFLRVLFVLALSVPGTAALAQIKVAVSPVDTTIALGDSVTVCVTVDGPPADLKGYLIRVRYNPAVLGHGQTDPGSVLDGYAATFIPASTPPDTIGFDAAVLIGSTNGPGSLGCFRFQGIAAGTSPVTITAVILRNSLNESYATVVCHGSVTVIPPTPVDDTTWSRVKTGSQRK